MIDMKLDLSGFKKAAEELTQGAKATPAAVARAVNHTGAKVLTAMRRDLAEQTGLKRKTIVKAIKKRSASAGNIAFVLTTRGGDVHLQFFGARETRAGVSAAPWGKRRIYAGTFMKGGRFPQRVEFTKPGMEGHVFARVGSDRLPLVGGRSGLFIPKEMVKGKTAEGFYRVVTTDLIDRIVHEVTRAL